MKSSYFVRLLPAVVMAARRATVDAKAVFAHFMVGNVADYKDSDWESDMTLAREAGIDAFALNIAAGDGSTERSLATGFRAAEKVGFPVFFSFDYKAAGAWPRDRVVALVNRYKTSAAYWKHESKPLVSTFLGVDNTGDWASIKRETGCFFVPDWSSKPVAEQVAVEGVDGLFNWGSWPDGASDMTDAQDRSYLAELGGKSQRYMMGVSPWFYTNLPGWGKNWVWRGEGLWFDRWRQVLALRPDMVEIISWNDYGESHYVGPVRATGYGLFGEGKAPFNYVEGMPHDGWRRFLPWLIRQYKGGGGAATSDANDTTATLAPAQGRGPAGSSSRAKARTAASSSSALPGPVPPEEEGLTVWYRLVAAGTPGCDHGGTTGNDAGHGQAVTDPGRVLEDRVFFSALLGSVADLRVSIGGKSLPGARWEKAPAGGSGMFFGSVPFAGFSGEVVVEVVRGGRVVANVKGASIATSCVATKGFLNWNAWVGSS